MFTHAVEIYFIDVDRLYLSSRSDQVMVPRVGDYVAIYKDQNRIEAKVLVVEWEYGHRATRVTVTIDHIQPL